MPEKDPLNLFNFDDKNRLAKASEWQNFQLGRIARQNRKLANETKRIAEAQEYANYLKEKELRDRYQKEAIEEWLKLYNHYSQIAKSLGAASLSHEEMCLIRKHPVEANDIVPMDERQRDSGYVNIECFGCGLELNVPDNQQGIFSCPDCTTKVFLDTSIPYNWKKIERRRMKEQDIENKARAIRIQNGIWFLFLTLPICLLVFWVGTFGKIIGLILVFTVIRHARKEYF